MRPPLRFVQAKPALPAPLGRLEELAHNLLWDWSPNIRSLFARIDHRLWKETGANPVALLGRVGQERLEELASDVNFLAHFGGACEELDAYKARPAWFQTEHVEHANLRIAYFSAEFGITPCLPIYSGGLGVLAGDHLKSASDLGLPLMGVGLLYQEGYFRQVLNADGWQMERYPPNDFHNLPIQLVRRPDGSAVSIYVQFPGRHVHAQVWRVEVGRVPLFLLDTNVDLNRPEDRGITRSLYGGGVELRIQQLMILGIGGFRALVEMGLEPTVCHMNEGHAGLLGVERARHLMQRHSIPYELARDLAEDGNLFTTHTPVPAGFDVFGRDLVERHASAYAASVGMSVDEFMKLGRRKQGDQSEPLNMAILAVRHAVRRNAVSALHGKVSRRMAQDRGAWQHWPEEEVPIGHITNGVHLRSVIAPEMERLLDRYLSPDWRERLYDPETWKGVDAIPDEELWRTHSELRMQLVLYVRERLAWQAGRRGGDPIEIEHAAAALDPDALTIGFARRFATYKRATLLFSDLDRLDRLVDGRRVQFVFAGKAHPADLPAKELIKQISGHVKSDRFFHSVAFLEDYDIEVARHMVRGVDVWLNNPQRPREASGTSGMKVVPNGGLNCSILDGWWDEGYRPEVGWAIGNGEDYESGRDELEANALYEALERRVRPCFYERDARDLPQRWIQMMKAGMRQLAPFFNTDRMVRDYCDQYYLAAARQFRVSIDDPEASRTRVEWKHRIRETWPRVRITRVEGPQAEARVGERFQVEAEVDLAGLSPEDVRVELYHGQVDALNEMTEPSTVPMEPVGTSGNLNRFRGALGLGDSGRVGYTVRVIPSHADILVPHEMTHIRWAEGS
ncbi:MAG: alpha-glucan family phosphorylase [Myxococcota bacterium]